MIIVSWNARGLWRLEKRLAVRKMVRQHKADLLLLQETKIARDVENVIFEVSVARNCGLDWVPSEGSSGGLISIWNNENPQGISAMKTPRVLAIKFQNRLDDILRASANVYGPNVDGERSPFWAHLSSLLLHWAIPWCLGGDFDLIRFPHEKKIGRYVSRSMARFSNFIVDNKLIDLPPGEEVCLDE
eukprot:TRINITY_DN2282_c1_g2_i1.p1 TRINITY_DN2282_c1_g2~~TRINITY_DN2282_c1_g2_i1.p1  ORF type:complete len:187 (+),score=25.94 TRINITY_DN2282_c1_g2_i1:3182-3742(+)